MPTATPFTALGVGNGFPSCLGKVEIGNLSGGIMWTTLSGVNADNYTSFGGAALAQKVSESLELAMKLYWNKFKLNGLSASSSGDLSRRTSRFFPIDEPRTESWNGNVSGMTSADANAAGVLEPINRVCGGGAKRILKFENVEGVNQDGDTVFSASLELDEKSYTVYGIYDGDTLLGYAVSNFCGLFSKKSGFVASISRASIVVSNFLDKDSDIDEDFHKQETGYQSVNGFYFVVIKIGRIEEQSTKTGDGYSGQTNQPSIVFTSLGVHVSYVYAYTYTADDDPNCSISPVPRSCFDSFVDDNYTFSVSGPTSIDFYTY